MLPFCGYNMGDYFGHWLEIGAATDGAKLPKLFWVNWFRKDDDGKFLWPGLRREQPRARVGLPPLRRHGRRDRDADRAVPTAGALDTDGLDISEAELAELLKVDAEEWKPELPAIQEHFARFGDRVPEPLRDELSRLEQRLDEPASS